MIVDFGGYVCLDSFARGWKLERCVRDKRSLLCYEGKNARLVSVSSAIA